MTRTESQRIHHEFEKFYAKHPKLRCQANHKMFLDAAEADGGSELLTMEWMELQMDSLKLAVLSETPEEALDRFMADNPAYDCKANRQIISTYMKETSANVQQAVSALQNQLAFNQEIASEQATKQEAAERQELARYIAKIYAGREDGYAFELEHSKLLGASLDYLRNRAQQIRESTRLSKLSKEELRKHIREQRGAQATPALPELPKYVERSALVALLNATDVSSAAFPIELLDGKSFSNGTAAFKYLCEKYSFDEVNKRLGTYVEPQQIAGRVRQVNMESLTK